MTGPVKCKMSDTSCFLKITFSCVEAILAPAWGGSAAGVAAALRPPGHKPTASPPLSQKQPGHPTEVLGRMCRSYVSVWLVAEVTTESDLQRREGVGGHTP